MWINRGRIVKYVKKHVLLMARLIKEFCKSSSVTTVVYMSLRKQQPLLQTDQSKNDRIQNSTQE